jgi:uncharacterized protein YwqG
MIMNGKIILSLALIGATVIITLLSQKGVQAVRDQKRHVKVRQLMDEHKRPSVQLQPTYRAARAGSSKLGGVPDVPRGFEWPRWKKASLVFLGQINLSEVAAVHRNPDMPAKGIIWFFYNKEQETWGFDPKDAGSWRVIYRENTAGLAKASLPGDLKPNDVFKESGMNFKVIDSYPSWESPLLSGMSDAESDLYGEKTAENEGTIHKLFGFPDQIQGEMQLDCQLASNGVSVGSPEGYQSSKVKQLAAGASDWQLLLQIDSDDRMGMMWGDAGRVYFWYKKAKPVDFDKVWMVLQCY